MNLALYRAAIYWRMPLGTSHLRTQTLLPLPLTSRSVNAMGKRKADAGSDDESPEDLSEYEEEVVEKKKKPRAKPKPKRSGPFVTGQGWNVVPPSLIWRDFDTEPQAKIAAFDLDGTLVNPKGSASFARTADDYKFFNKKVVKKVQEFHEDGYKIVIFTNQGGIKTALEGKMAERQQQRATLVVNELGVPVQVFMAPSMADGDAFRKPATGMWDFMTSDCNGGVKPDLKASFFVGDAAGRQQDHGNTDKGFAEAVGIKFKTPEEVFGEMDGKRALQPGSIGLAELKKAAGVGPGGGGGEGGGGEIAGPNAEIIKLFLVAADIAKNSGEDKAHFKANALAKAGQALTTFPDKITSANLKEVGKLAGVGKGSLDKIKEYLETGTIAAAQGAAAKPAAPPTKAQEMAATFM